MTPVVIRPASEADLPVLAAVERSGDAAFERAGYQLPVGGSTVAPEVLGQACSDGRLFVAGSEGRPVGFAVVVQLDGNPHLEQISVEHDHQGRGIGSQLLSVVLQWATEQGSAAVTLSTSDDVPWNRPFYERRGFYVLAEEAWTPGLIAVREHEQADGLDMSRRVLMCHVL